jgi:hypothetical protein
MTDEEYDEFCTKFVLQHIERQAGMKFPRLTDEQAVVAVTAWIEAKANPALFRNKWTSRGGPGLSTRFQFHPHSDDRWLYSDR